MGGCNTTQNESGGKDLLLKTCVDLTASVAGTTAIHSVAHGLKLGDVIKFGETEGSISASLFYFVTEVTDVDNFKVAATPGGAAITVNATDATVALLAFKTLGGLRTKTFSFAADGIDITSHDSDQWSKLLDGAGIRKLSASGEGVFTNETLFKSMQSAAFTNALVCLMFVDVKSGWIFEGCFKLTALELSGGYDGEGTYSLSAESSGEITVQQPA